VDRRWDSRSHLFRHSYLVYLLMNPKCVYYEGRVFEEKKRRGVMKIISQIIEYICIFAVIAYMLFAIVQVVRHCIVELDPQNEGGGVDCEDPAITIERMKLFFGIDNRPPHAEVIKPQRR